MLGEEVGSKYHMAAARCLGTSFVDNLNLQQLKVVLKARLEIERNFVLHFIRQSVLRIMVGTAKWWASPFAVIIQRAAYHTGLSKEDLLETQNCRLVQVKHFLCTSSLRVYLQYFPNFCCGVFFSIVLRA